ncbi:MAG: SPFH domain-containing protein [Myxococcota bacterium]|nr:SPFH domain-containing protein [Myxococcota bacterium]
MGITDFLKRGVQEIMVARPDEAKDLAIYKHPDQTVPTFAELTVDADEVAIFFKDGRAVGKLPPGRHSLRTENVPFLSNLVDAFTGGNVFIAEVFFVSTRQFPGQKFGGRIGSVEDPKSGVPVEIKVHGDFSLQITEPQTLILGLVGMRQAENDAFFHWFKQQVLKVMRDQTAELIVKKRWPVLDVVSGAYTEEIEQTVLDGVKKHVDHYGVQIVQLGNVTLSIDKEDEKNLKKLYTDAAYVRMAGGMQEFQQFASGKAMMGAGEGMSQGGGGDGEGGGQAMLGGAALGVGFGMAGMMQQGHNTAPDKHQQQHSHSQPGQVKGSEASSSPETITCSACGASVGKGKFCAACGTPLTSGTPEKYCSNCGSRLDKGTKFCKDCGTKVES